MKSDLWRRKNPYATRVVITGLGTINPLGNNVPEFWDNLLKGKSGVRLARNIDLKDSPVKIAAELDLPDLSSYFKEKRMIRRLDRYIILAHIAASQAIIDAGLNPEAEPTRIGSLIGTGDGGVNAQLENVTRIVKTGISSVAPFYIINAIPNTATAYVSQHWHLEGPCFSVNSACATSNHALGLASLLIKWGLADVMVAGGSEAPVTVSGIAAFAKIQALSERNDSPETASRPFDRQRDGFVLGEGAGALCLEELEHAKRRGAKIYAELKGFGFSCDAYDFVMPHPQGLGAARAIKLALDDAGLEPDEIDLINAHATSTPVGDKAEARSIQLVFGDNTSQIPVQATKSMIGHSLGATSAIEAIAAILAFEKNVIHPTINVFEQDPEIKLNIVKDQPQEKRINTILSNAFGFGGQNAVLVLSRFQG